MSMDIVISNGVYNELASEILFEVGMPAKLTPTAYLQGTQGIQGIQGCDGPLGIQGVQGFIGLHGHIGLQGPAGYGLQGVQGPQGNGIPEYSSSNNNTVLGVQNEQIQWLPIRSTLLNPIEYEFTDETEISVTIPGSVPPFGYLILTEDNKNVLAFTALEYQMNETTITISATFNESKTGTLYLV